MKSKTDEHDRRSALPLAEFVVLMALMTSLVALAIDAMLPALPEIGSDLGAVGNEAQLILSLLFLGLACGQMLCGPLSDSLGRKPVVLAGFIVFIGGTLFSLFATAMPVMLIGRFLQGLGLAAPRIVSMALVRDLFEGRAMARIMSFIMSVFVLVPALAPALGQGILYFSGWRAIFGSFLFLALLLLAWFMLRQPETLAPEKRRAFSLKSIGGALREILTHRIALGYTLATGCIMSAFLGYLTSAQPVFQDQYGLGDLFPLYFAVLALAIGLASVVNGRMVVRYGMRRMSMNALRILCIVSLLFLGLAWFREGHPPLWQLMTYMSTAVFCTGILFGNLNAMAMEPLGHIAGIGAAVVGSLSTIIAVPLGSFIGLSFNGTVMPMLLGFCVFGLCTLGVVIFLGREKGGK